MVPFPRSQHICNCKHTCQRVLCLLTWRHQQRVASHCFGKLWLWGEFTWPISSVHGSFGEHLGRPKIAHGSHNDVRRLCCPNLGCEDQAETPKGSLCWENLCGCMGVWLGCTDWGVCTSRDIHGLQLCELIVHFFVLMHSFFWWLVCVYMWRAQAYIRVVTVCSLSLRNTLLSCFGDGGEYITPLAGDPMHSETLFCGFEFWEMFD